MKYYTLARKVGDNAAQIRKKNNRLVLFSSGHMLPDSFEEPLLCQFYTEFENGDMPTLFINPAVIATPAFYQDLLDLGVDNIEVKPVLIRSDDGRRVVDDYLLLNILGRISGADLDASEVQSLGEGMNIIDQLVFPAAAIRGRKLFLVDEDTDCIVISEDIYQALSAKYDDLFFDEVTLV